MIGILDYGTGNVKSVMNMLRKIGAAASLVADPKGLKSVEKIILPGVGSFDAAMSELTDMGMVSVLDELVLDAKIPVLGICLGMQLFAKSSEEGKSKGLGWIDGYAKRFDFSDFEKPLKVPHMGWNFVSRQRDHFLLRDVPEPMRFYFVHSYHLVCSQEEDVLATTNYGYAFPSVLAYNNVYGVQFHPEKSHKYGMAVLRNFVEFA